MNPEGQCSYLPTNVSFLRELRLAGCEVYRFGANELVGRTSLWAKASSLSLNMDLTNSGNMMRRRSTGELVIFGLSSEQGFSHRLLNCKLRYIVLTVSHYCRVAAVMELRFLKK